MLLQALIRSGMISFDLALNFLFDLSSLLLLGLIVRVSVVCEHVAKDVIISPLILLRAVCISCNHMVAIPMSPTFVCPGKELIFVLRSQLRSQERG